MPDDAPIENVRAAIAQRLRHERALGIETVAPVALERRAAPTAASESILYDDVELKEAPAAPEAPVNAEDKAARWAALEARAQACAACALHRERQTVVFGEGNRDAQLVFVGEGPGEQEDKTGRPFVGPAGQLLDKIIGAIGLKRDDVYICNIVKCRPPGNRTPADEEVALCRPFLDEQLALLAPKVIVTLGAPATKTLLGTTQGITSLRGHWRLYKNIRVMPTFHPAFLLRQYTDANRRAVWSDMKQVVEKIKE
ncbi:MAG: uracil-DNA glycosylase [Planctomycetes bacterium]|nr:uracil-DNA glycosylase [Planctomycetota bacterium]